MIMSFPAKLAGYLTVFKEWDLTEMKRQGSHEAPGDAETC